MAGYDQQPAKFAAVLDGNTDVRGQTALDYYPGPEVGPGMLQAVSSALYDLVARLDTIGGGTYHTQPHDTPPTLSQADLEGRIQGYMPGLRGGLRGVSKSHRDRTVYCLLRLPQEGTPQRDFRHLVLSEVRKRVIEGAPDLKRHLVFVELMHTPTEREAEVGTYIRARIMRT